MDEYIPTPAQLSEDADRLPFLLRTEGGEVTELHPTMQGIFRGVLARLWQAAYRTDTDGS